MGNDKVIQISTFSKTFCPGLRIGYIATKNEDILDKIIKYKQHNDLCSPAYTQALMSRVLSTEGFYGKNIEKLRKYYKPKRDIMLKSLEEHMPNYVEWNRPEGGLFLSVRFPKKINTDMESDFTNKCIENGIVYVPGSTFYPPPYCENHRNEIRLTFGYPTEEEIRKGIKILGKTTEDFL